MARRDRTLAEFLVMLDGYKPLVGPIDCCHGSWLINKQIPEEVTEYYLQRSGFDCSDPRLYVRPRSTRAGVRADVKETPLIPLGPKIRLGPLA